MAKIKPVIQANRESDDRDIVILTKVSKWAFIPHISRLIITRTH